MSLKNKELGIKQVFHRIEQKKFHRNRIKTNLCGAGTEGERERDVDRENHSTIALADKGPFTK